MSLIRFFAAAGVVWIQTSCSSAILSRGPDVGRYAATGKTFTRATVVDQLGTPTSSTRFQQPRLVSDFVAEGHPAFQGIISNSSARVGLVDEYVLRGRIENNKDTSVTGGLAIITLGLSEFVFVPLAVADAISTVRDSHHLYMVYSPADILVAHHLIEAK